MATPLTTDDFKRIISILEAHLLLQSQNIEIKKAQA